MTDARRRNNRGLTMPSGRRIPRPRDVPPHRPPVPDDPGDELPAAVTKAAGELAALASAVRACRDCARADAPRVYGSGYPRAPVMLVKAHPSPSDVESGNAFTDEAEALGKAFEALHVPLGWLYGSVAVRCGLDGATGAQTAACSSHLLVEIEAVQPRVLVAFGRPTVDALRSLDGRCGLTVPADVPAGEPVALRGDLVLLATEPMPDGVKVRDSKRRLWRDLQAVPSLLGPGRA